MEINVPSFFLITIAFQILLYINTPFLDITLLLLYYYYYLEPFIFLNFSIISLPRTISSFQDGYYTEGAESRVSGRIRNFDERESRTFLGYKGGLGPIGRRRCREI